MNDEIKYACKSGYTKASGSEKLNCIMNNSKAEWNGKPLNCKSMCLNIFLKFKIRLKLTFLLFRLVITCTDPGEVAHATKIVKDPNYSFGSQVSYHCSTNFMSDSKPVILCDRNGQWNRKKPVCKCRCFFDLI